MTYNGTDNFTINRSSSDEDRERIRHGITEFNAQTVPAIQSLPYENCNLIIKDDAGSTLGGLAGRMYLASFFIEFLWVSEKYRKCGFGSMLLKEAERVAKDKGCKLIDVDTFSFQAPDFYKKNGYEVFGVLDGFAEGISRYFLKKSL